jgi:hypothetical protein
MTAPPVIVVNHAGAVTSEAANRAAQPVPCIRIVVGFPVWTDSTPWEGKKTEKLGIFEIFRYYDDAR